jgi:hypothetical protein
MGPANKAENCRVDILKGCGTGESGSIKFDEVEICRSGAGVLLMLAAEQGFDEFYS